MKIHLIVISIFIICFFVFCYRVLNLFNVLILLTFSLLSIFFKKREDVVLFGMLFSFLIFVINYFSFKFNIWIIISYSFITMNIFTLLFILKNEILLVKERRKWNG